MKRILLILTALCACLVSCKKADLDKIKTITLDVTESTLKTGEAIQLTATLLPGTASDKPIQWTSSNPAVASVTKDGLVKALAHGSSDITVKAKKGDAAAVCKVKVINQCPANAVDMGTNVYWAPCNLGASSQEQPGGFYAWDETSPKTSFPKRTITNAEIVKRITEDRILKPEYDAATVALGGTWRLPTQNEYYELWNKCSKSEKTINGQKGMLFRSNITNKELFFPYGGWIAKDNVLDKDEEADLRVGNVGYSNVMSFWEDTYVLLHYNNVYSKLDIYYGSSAGLDDSGYCGRNIRPVCD